MRAVVDIRYIRVSGGSARMQFRRANVDGTGPLGPWLYPEEIDSEWAKVEAKPMSNKWWQELWNRFLS